MLRVVTICERHARAALIINGDAALLIQSERFNNP